MHGKTIEQVAAEIEAYLAARPGAEDSAEGVSNWWLGSGHRDAPAVRAALDLLVARGRVLVVTVRGLKTYRHRRR